MIPVALNSESLEVGRTAEVVAEGERFNSAPLSSRDVTSDRSSREVGLGAVAPQVRLKSIWARREGRKVRNIWTGRQT